MRRFSIALSSLPFLFTAALAQEPGRLPSQPIMIEGDPSFDPCGNGVIEGLDPAGDGFLSVRAAPGSGNAEIERLYNGEQAYWCAEDGNWVGIVYTKERRDCNVSSPWMTTAPYTGPCKSGWVHKNWIRLFAG